MNLEQRKQWVTDQFKTLYGRPPEIWSRAPGRVDLMGSHTDYNMGYVMTITIDRDTWIAAAPRNDERVRIQSLNVAGESEFSLNQIVRDADVSWANYVRGMAKVLKEEGFELRGFDGLIHSTVPFGSGVSSSAAIEMATGVLLSALGGFTMEPTAMAVLGQKAENTFVGVNCGVLDQYSSAKGQSGCALMLDCRVLTSRPVPIAPGLQVMICDTRAKRNLAGTEYGERRAQCEDGTRLLSQVIPNVCALRDVSLAQFDAHQGVLSPLTAKRCRFIVEENQRVLDLENALSCGDRAQLRKLYEASFAGARDLYEISVPAMQSMRDAIMNAPGAIAARQAGAGFGGCLVAIVETGFIKEFEAAVIAQYQAETGLEPAILAVQAADGAGLM